MTHISKIFALLMASVISSSAYAVPTNSWTVSDAAGNCDGGPHGLWTNETLGTPSCGANYFSISGTLTQFDDGTATLFATAINPDNVEAVIDLTFGGYTEDHTSLPLKTGGGSANVADWVFYTTVAGTIEIDGLGTFDALGLTGGHGLQIGWGANDKTTDFGASAWLDMGHAQSIDEYVNLNGHWDLNLDLVAVPEPSALLLLATGLVSISVFRRKRN